MKDSFCGSSASVVKSFSPLNSPSLALSPLLCSCGSYFQLVLLGLLPCENLTFPLQKTYVRTYFSSLVCSVSSGRWGWGGLTLIGALTSESISLECWARKDSEVGSALQEVAPFWIHGICHAGGGRLWEGEVPPYICFYTRQSVTESLWLDHSKTFVSCLQILIVSSLPLGKFPDFSWFFSKLPTTPSLYSIPPLGGRGGCLLRVTFIYPLKCHRYNRFLCSPYQMSPSWHWGCLMACTFSFSE